jgi:RHH-type transcriptional regulator, proline utilization regulon repressor / proline dehydrogenase / delta 1-pyrroline-5-carboxylate dehydrogenase
MELRFVTQDLAGDFQLDPFSTLPARVQKAVFLARRLQERAIQLQTPSEKRQQAELECMLQNPADKATLVQITDQAFRSRDPRRAIKHLVHILDVQGVPRCFSHWDRTLMKGLQSFGACIPGVALPLVKEHLQKETANVILPGEEDLLTQHLQKRIREGVRVNVNFLGEAILSEAEAQRRLQQYLTALHWPEIEVVSIKISTLYSRISPLAREDTVSILCDRLELLFRTADRLRFRGPTGGEVPKFVYLDMEEYRDKDLTAEAFTRTLDRPGLERARAGIALQSYIPDSYRTLQKLQSWARRRASSGGGRITIRLVKGANMESERVEASLRGWPQAPYHTKLETDANYKKMLEAALAPENLVAMDVGVASHNLFDLAYGFVLAEERKALDQVQFEMLEGMANHQRRAFLERSRNLLLYAPACKREHFISGIGYLIRRLDENTGPENFLRHAFKLEAGSPDWNQLEKAFLKSFEAMPRTSDAPRRTQDRAQPPEKVNAVAGGWENLASEPDTDFSLPQNGRWAEQILARWKPRCGENAPQVPLVFEGEEIFAGGTARDCLDPSRPGVIAGRYREAGLEEIRRAVDCADADPDGWRTLSPPERFDVLGKVAQELRKARADLIGAALANGGKTVPESDPEVSEAIDFVEFYRANARWWQELPTLRARGKGVVVVAPPWNFPIAIPCGGVAASLAAGNTVILKPASHTVLVAWELCQCFWRGGVSRRALQFIPCSGSQGGPALVNHSKVGAVILTGGTGTALNILRDNPRLQLFAETGGKDATIVTAISDRDQAIKHVLHSAFSHAGQKCSATSLLLLQDEVYDDSAFKRALCEAAESIRVGSAWKLETQMGPLIRPPCGDLETALKVLEPGEEWALPPRPAPDNPSLWTPGIKYGVQPGSYSHRTEFFGPVLAVMRFNRLAEAVALVNQTGYGLTSGLESLDEREWDYWKAHIRAGNLYINRVTTGAIVLRQPFGGWGKSSFGPGMKAGGPNYVPQFMDLADVPDRVAPGNPPQSPALLSLCESLQRGNHPDTARIMSAVGSYEKAFRGEFGQEHDHFKLLGQDNFRRYLPAGTIHVRVDPGDSAFEVFARVSAAYVTGNRVVVSLTPGVANPELKVLEEWAQSCAVAIEFVEQTDQHVIAAMQAGKIDRLRYAAPGRVPDAILTAAAASGVPVISRPVSAEGRLELLWYLLEQSVSIDYHRYGNLGLRAGEQRAPVL